MTDLLQQFIVRLNAISSRPPAAARRPKPQTPPAGADWLALAQSPPDRSRTVYDPSGSAVESGFCSSA